MNGRRSEDFITGREQEKKITAGGRGVNGRRSEDFITGREQEKKITAGGRGVSGRRSEDFITERDPQTGHCWDEGGGEWRNGRLYCWEGAPKQCR